MTRRITESQLRKIIAEAAQKILNEYKRSPLSDNPGGAKNDRVAWKGYMAQFDQPGKRWGKDYEHHNDSTYYVTRKHNGGLNPKRNIIQSLVAAVKENDETAAKEFISALSHIPDLYLAIYNATKRYSQGIEK